MKKILLICVFSVFITGNVQAQMFNWFFNKPKTEVIVPKKINEDSITVARKTLNNMLSTIDNCENKNVELINKIETVSIEHKKEIKVYKDRLKKRWRRNTVSIVSLIGIIVLITFK